MITVSDASPRTVQPPSLEPRIQSEPLPANLSGIERAFPDSFNSFFEGGKERSVTPLHLEDPSVSVTSLPSLDRSTPLATNSGSQTEFMTRSIGTQTEPDFRGAAYNNPDVRVAQSLANAAYHAAVLSNTDEIRANLAVTSLVEHLKNTQDKEIKPYIAEQLALIIEKSPYRNVINKAQEGLAFYNRSKTFSFSDLFQLPFRILNMILQKIW